ncbi:MAG: GerW family sporulation protein [Lachnospiraceae bacterium]|nr:GerW family sporulation protein [Lachnospiraceae bacterium]
MDEKNSMASSMESLIRGMETFLSSKTVVGEPIRLGDAIILPLVDISFGCASGAAAGGKNSKEGTAGGMNGKITPSAVLVIQNGTTKLVNIKTTDNVSKLIDMVPELVNKFTTGKEHKVTVSDDDVKKAVNEQE